MQLCGINYIVITPYAVITTRSVLCAIDFTLNVGRNEMLESEGVTGDKLLSRAFFVNLLKLSLCSG